MDRNQHWDRIGKAYNAMVCGKGEQFDNAVSAVKESYLDNVTDEFIVPLLVKDEKVN